MSGQRTTSTFLDLDLRRRIATGQYVPGEQIPDRDTLEIEYGAARATIQKALDALKRDGFVHARRKAGTFVTDSPPHLNNYGLVIPVAARESRFISAIRMAAKIVGAEAGVTFHEYVVTRHPMNTVDLPRLTEDVLAHRLGALVFASAPYELNGTPVIDEVGLARVAFQSAPSRGMPSVYVDGSSFLERALEHVRRQGRKRIAHLALCDSHHGARQVETEIRSHLRKHEYRPWWLQIMGSGPLDGANHLVQMMLKLERDERPDALIVHDDNLAEPTLRGLEAAKVRVPDELEVVVHSNFPDVPETPLPVRRLGFDAVAMMRWCLRSIDQQRKGKTRPLMHTMPAVFEEELAQESTVATGREP